MRTVRTLEKLGHSEFGRNFVGGERRKDSSGVDGLGRSTLIQLLESHTNEIRLIYRDTVLRSSTDFI
jgi:hypothetical protein